MTALRHLVHLLRGTWFRRLFAVRIGSQLTDGVFQVALASYVVFAPERAPGPGAIASALAVVLLPFSVLGPFVGVLLDRWSRRQVLAWSNFVRVGLVAVLALAVHAELRGPALFGLVLASLSVNRFLLAGLSASLPHVVGEEDLITANALTPTAGTLAFLTGLALGTGARIGWEGLGVDGDVGVLADRRAAVRRRRLPRAADPARPARARPGPGAPRRPRARAARRDGPRRRPPAPRGAPAGGVRPDRDRRAPLLLRHLDGVADPALPQLLPRPRRDRRGVQRAVGRRPGQRRSASSPPRCSPPSSPSASRRAAGSSACSWARR